MQKSKSGFTLVELLIVIIIIAILAGMTLITYRGAQARARDDRRKTDTLNLTKALELYYADNNAYPISSGTTSTLGSQWYASGDGSWTAFSTTLTTSNAMNSVPIDPNPSVTVSPWNTGGFQYTYISNGNCGLLPQGQWYMIVWRNEAVAPDRFVSGSCTTAGNASVATASGGGSSYYLFSRI